MEHSWILLLAMIGHVLCVYADRLLLCTPGGQFGFSDMKDNTRIATMIMTFSTFGFYGQIWFNRTFTYEAAVDEMPAGYAEGLMAVSPDWAFPVVVVIGLALSAVICNVTAKLFKVEKS